MLTIADKDWTHGRYPADRINTDLRMPIIRPAGGWAIRSTAGAAEMVAQLRKRAATAGIPADVAACDTRIADAIEAELATLPETVAPVATVAPVEAQPAPVVADSLAARMERAEADRKRGVREGDDRLVAQAHREWMRLARQENGRAWREFNHEED